MSTPAKLPSRVESEILSSVQAYHSDAVKRLATDASSKGQFSSWSSAISQLMSNASTLSGDVMYQMAKCFIADAYASKLRADLQDSIHNVKNGNYSTVVIEWLDALDCRPHVDDGIPRSELLFLQQYDLGVDAMNRWRKDLAFSTAKDEESQSNLDSLLEPKDNFFDTLVAASKVVQHDPAAWQVAQHAFMLSLRVRENLQNVRWRESVNDLKQELGIALDVWPDLPKVLTDAAKTMTMTTYMLRGDSLTSG